MRITILTNGPGELWGWVRPVVYELRRRGHSVSLWLLPCQYASGHEREAASLLGVDKLEGPMSASRLWRALPYEKTDYVLQLGGDLIFGSRIARASRVPLACYTYGFKKGMKNAQVFTAFHSQLEALKNFNARAIGDLVHDALLLDMKEQIPTFKGEPSPAYGHLPQGGRQKKSPTSGEMSTQLTERACIEDAIEIKDKDNRTKILFLPGSRPLIRRAVLPWLVNLNNALKNLMPNIITNTLLPPFIPDKELIEWHKAGLNPIKTGAGVAMAQADFAMTQPGTNTLELMHSGLPALVVAPESFLDIIPMSGLKSFIASVPVIGRKIKRSALQKTINKWGGFIALPNRIANKLIIDEMYGDISIEQIANRAAEILNNPEHLRTEREELLNLSRLSGGAGAAGRLCDAIMAL